MAKEEKLKKANETKDWLQQVRGSDAEGKKGYERVLWICVNRYYRPDLDKQRENGKGLTLFFAHANGFSKEVGVAMFSTYRMLTCRRFGNLRSDICWPPVHIL